MGCQNCPAAQFWHPTRLLPALLLPLIVASCSAAPSTVTQASATPPATSASASGSAQTLLTGSVVVTSSCGNQPTSGTCPTSKSAIATTVRVLGSDSHVIAQTQSKADGTFAVRLPRGRYTVEVEVAPAMPPCDAPVDVPASGTVTTQIECDAGIP